MNPKYDKIGINYTNNRATDPRIAQQLYAALEGASRILNIGAGTGSYEPTNVDLIGIEPSSEMIAQRESGAHPVIQAQAEKLPFEDKSFSHSMAILSIHHWEDRAQAFREVKRVTRDKFVAISWDAGAGPFWLTRDYFPEFFKMDAAHFPNLDELGMYFEEVKMLPIPIPEDCQDGFLAAYWKRPEAYLDPKIRLSISSFSKIADAQPGLDKLKNDLASGLWEQKNAAMLDKTSIDAGYRLIIAKI
ncbi:MAG: class I SAM-dependent methyltransferase [Bacteroidota bacterium]